MKALVLNGPGEPFSLETVPDPVPGPGEAVAKVIACGAGLTIQHVKAGRAKVDYPRIIGHEITGVIEAVGEGVTNVAVGDPVTAYFYLTCGHCKWCRINRETLCENFGGYIGRACDGGYAELMKLPARNFLKFPENLHWQNHAAEIGVITDAIATPVKVVRHAGIKAGETVAVFGAGGGLGIHMLMLAKWAHAKVIAVDIASDKFEACRSAGADECVNPRDGNAVEALKDLSGGGIDVAIDFVSSRETLETAVQCLGRGGRMVTLGGSGENFSAHAHTMLEKELVLMGSRYATRQEVIESLELCARGEVWPLVTETADMAGAEALHERVERGLVTGRAAILVSTP
ncbi:MAG: alcohol dehydrogenase catalytic domain-containing protein [Alphaproteobacteria bacterium]